MNSIEVIYEVIKKLNLYDFRFNLVSHKARLNWRQDFPTFYDKIENVKTGIQFDKDKIMSLEGKDFADSNFVANYISDEEPLLSIASLIQSKNGEEFHLPMMNLHIDYPLSINTLHITLERMIGKSFVLLKTDRFYHVYSDYLMTFEEWKLWNLRFLMIDCLVSPRYIGHSLERGYNLLRINSAKIIKTTIPHSFADREDKLTAVEQFAVVKHGNQKRNSGELYFHHLFEVKKITQNILKEIKYRFSVEDENNILMAAILHDTIEDTNTDYEDILLLTNKYVADLVEKLSNDKRIQKDLRDALFLIIISQSNLDVQIIKLADILSNLKSVEQTEDEKWKVTFAEKCYLFLQNMRTELRDLQEYDESLILINRMIKHAKDNSIESDAP